MNTINSLAVAMGFLRPYLVPMKNNVGSRCVKLTAALGIAVAMIFAAGAAYSAPYASGLTNNNGTISFYLNEGGANVTVTFEDGSTNGDYNGLTSGTNLAAGQYTFALGSHTSYSILVSKSRTGSPVLISSFGFATSRGLDVNKNPASPYFGRVYAAQGGVGIYMFNSDLSPVSSNVLTAGVDWNGNSSSPYRIAIAPDDYVMAGDASASGSAVWRLDPGLTTNQLFLGPVGEANGQAAGTHGTEQSRPLITGSIEGSNAVLYEVDGDFPAIGPYNSLLIYQIGAGPLPWSNPPNLVGPEIGVDLDSENLVGNEYPGLTQGPNGYLYASTYRNNYSNPNLQIYSATGTNQLWNSFYNGSDSDYFVNSSPGENGTNYGICDSAVSPDGRYLAGLHIDNHLTVVSLTNGIPDVSTLFIIVPTSFAVNARGLAWDAADNLYVSSSGIGAVQSWTLGLDSIAITGNDITGTNGTFQLIAGSVFSLSAPAVATGPASAVTATTATLNGWLDPNGLDTLYYFQYGADPGLTNPIETTVTDFGSGTNLMAVSASISGLSADAEYYYYRLVAVNAAGTNFGVIQYFAYTSPPPPLPNFQVELFSASQLGSTYDGAPFTGTPVSTFDKSWAIYPATNGLPGGLSAEPSGNGPFDRQWWPLGTNAEFGARITAEFFAPAADTYSFGTWSDDGSTLWIDGTEIVTNGGQHYETVATATTYLTAGYHTMIVNYWENGSGDAALVAQVDSRLLSASLIPMAVTTPASAIVQTTATLNGSVNPEGVHTVYSFEYSTDYTLTNAISSSSLNIGYGTSNSPVSVNLTGLTPDTAYYFRLVAQSDAGASAGNILSFTTDPSPGGIMSAGSLSNSLTVGLAFNTQMDPITASTANNYEVPGSTVNSAILQTNGRLAVLSLSNPVLPGVPVEVQGVADISSNIMNSTNVIIGVSDLVSADVGTTNGLDPIFPGSTIAFASDAFQVSAGGSDIANDADGFHFTYQQVTGDFTLSVRVASLTMSDSYAKAGLMIRESLSGGSPNLSWVASPADGHDTVDANYRAQAGGATTNWPDSVSETPVPYPNAWLMLTRAGNTFTAFSSVDGVDWVTNAQMTVTDSYPATVLVGLCATAHTNMAGVYTVAEFDHFVLKTVETPPWLTMTATLSISSTSSNGINISWPTAANGFYLEESPSLFGTTWSPVAASPALAGLDNLITVNRTNGEQFFRLASNPTNYLEVHCEGCSGNGGGNTFGSGAGTGSMGPPFWMVFEENGFWQASSNAPYPIVKQLQTLSANGASINRVYFAPDSDSYLVSEGNTAQAYQNSLNLLSLPYIPGDLSSAFQQIIGGGHGLAYMSWVNNGWWGVFGYRSSEQYYQLGPNLPVQVSNALNTENNEAHYPFYPLQINLIPGSTAWLLLGFVDDRPGGHDESYYTFDASSDFPSDVWNYIQSNLVHNGLTIQDLEFDPWDGGGWLAIDSSYKVHYSGKIPNDLKNQIAEDQAADGVVTGVAILPINLPVFPMGPFQQPPGSGNFDVVAGAHGGAMQTVIESIKSNGALSAVTQLETSSVLNGFHGSVVVTFYDCTGALIPQLTCGERFGIDGNGFGGETPTPCSWGAQLPSQYLQFARNIVIAHIYSPDSIADVIYNWTHGIGQDAANLQPVAQLISTAGGSKGSGSGSKSSSGN